VSTYATALSGVQFGHSVFEQVYRIDGEGMVPLDKVAPRPQSSIAFWNVDRRRPALDSAVAGGHRSMPGHVVMAPTSIGANAIPGAAWLCTCATRIPACGRAIAFCAPATSTSCSKTS
jgi:hypothetical protein